MASRQREDWPSCAMVAAGMVGSRQGWREVPYVDVPADASAIARGMVSIDGAFGRLFSVRARVLNGELHVQDISDFLGFRARFGPLRSRTRGR